MFDAFKTENSEHCNINNYKLSLKKKKSSKFKLKYIICSTECIVFKISVENTSSSNAENIIVFTDDTFQLYIYRRQYRIWLRR